MSTAPQQATLRIVDSVLPILAADDRGRPRGVGTGFLLSIQGYAICATAAHVGDEAKLGQLYLPSRNSNPLELPTEFVSTVAPSGNRNLDKVDVGFWVLPPDLTSNLNPDHLFLPTQFLLPNADLDEDTPVTYVGYPHKNVKVTYKTPKYSIRAESFTSSCVPNLQLARMGGTDSANFGISFDASIAKLGTQKITPKDRRGMSGGPVVVLTDGGDALGIGPLRIVGLTIEHISTQKAILCTRIDALLLALSQHFGIQKFVVSDSKVNYPPRQ